jgi:hypothetical protein
VHRHLSRLTATAQQRALPAAAGAARGGGAAVEGEQLRLLADAQVASAPALVKWLIL